VWSQQLQNFVEPVSHYWTEMIHFQN
jgi:hypothetical protein